MLYSWVPPCNARFHQNDPAPESSTSCPSDPSTLVVATGVSLSSGSGDSGGDGPKDSICGTVQSSSTAKGLLAAIESPARPPPCQGQRARWLLLESRRSRIAGTCRMLSSGSYPPLSPLLLDGVRPVTASVEGSDRASHRGCRNRASSRSTPLFISLIFAMFLSLSLSRELANCRRR